MADTGMVFLLLALIWAAVLISPAAGARAAREAEFLESIRPDGELDIVDQPRFRPAITPKARRRQVLGGLVVAMGATLLVGMLPPFRLLLFVHLFLVNSCLAYVGLMVHLRDRQFALARVATSARSTADEARPVRRFAEPVHPYAAPEGLGYTDEFTYRDEPAHGYGDGDELTYREAPAYESGGTGFAEGWAEGWDEADEAEAAYVDDELAQPA